MGKSNYAYKNISVLLPVAYTDKLRYFKKSISSILNQTFDKYKLIICVDGPIKKNIDEYLKTLNDDRITVFRLKNNLGLASILNKAIKKYPSDIYIRMDSDDVCHPERFKKTINYFNNDQDLLLVGSEAMEIDQSGNDFFYKKLPSGEDILNWSFTRNPFIHSAISFRKEYFNIVGLYNENYVKSQDYELIARGLINNVKMTNIKEPLINVRIYSNFLKRRTLWINIINESKVSFLLIRKFKAFNHLPKLIAKIFTRILLRYLPSDYSKIAYKKLR